LPEEEKERSDPLLEHADAINEIVAKHYQLRVALNLIPVVGGSLSELFGGKIAASLKLPFSKVLPGSAQRGSSGVGTYP